MDQLKQFLTAIGSMAEVGSLYRREEAFYLVGDLIHMVIAGAMGASDNGQN